MAQEKSGYEPSRRRTIPLWGEQYDWWPQAVRRRLTILGIDQKMLADHIDADHTAVNKCITRKTPVYELLIAISDALDIPYPVVLPESIEEAIEVAKARRLARRDSHLDQIKAGVPNPRRGSQIEPISLVDVSKWKSQQNKTQEHRSKPARAARSAR